MAHEKVCRIVNEIADYYHFTDIDGELNGKRFPNNLVLMTLSYLLDKNHLIIGDPGWGKTTTSQVLSTKLSGIPFDLYESLMMQGSPGVFEEKLIGRPDYAKLVTGREEVIWQGCFGLDALIVDEINRVPPGTQAVLLEGIRTGRWRYLNDILYEGKKPTFLTMNNHDDGNGQIIPPLEDRVDIVTEEKAVSVLSDFLSADRRIRDTLVDEGITTQAIEALRRKEYAGFKAVIETNLRRDHLTKEEKSTIQKEIYKLPFSNDANYFLWAFVAEINSSEQYGVKRASDPISQSNHDKLYAGVNVKRSFSARSRMAAEVYSRGLAWILGNNQVDLDHVRYVLPYVSAHKIGFTKDYRNKHGNDHRTDYEDLHLAKELVKDVYKNYQKSVEPLKNLIANIQQGKAVEVNPDKYDHPLMKDIINKKLKQPKSDL